MEVKAFARSINHIMGCPECAPMHQRWCALGRRLYDRYQRRSLTRMVIDLAQQKAGRNPATLDDCRTPLRDPIFQEMLGAHRPVVMRMVRFTFFQRRDA